MKKIKQDFRNNKDPLFIGGFYLYWGEGTKSAEYTTALTSTDPAIIKTYIAWLKLLHVNINDCRIKLHLYADQDIGGSIKFWSQVTTLPSGRFYKPYIKQTLLQNKSYKGMFGFGTCTVYYHNRDIYEYVMAGLEVLRNQH